MITQETIIKLSDTHIHTHKGRELTDKKGFSMRRRDQRDSW